MREHAELHLAILGDRSLYHATAKNFKTEDVRNDYLKPDDVISVLSNLNDKGYSTWLSINTKENDAVTGVTQLCDLWLEIDARPKGVEDRPATKEELLIALAKSEKLKNYVENQYASNGFMAYSGNGYHIHFPLPIFDLPKEVRIEVNEKVKAFAKDVAKKADVKIDKAYDISRRTTLIGTLNQKIPGVPLQTCWEKTVLENGLEPALKNVDDARTQNKQLLETLIAYEKPKTLKTQTVTPNAKHIDIETLCQNNQKFSDLYKVGDHNKYGFPSRSEAEESVLTILVMEGFSDEEITVLMESCALGKWQETTSQYHILSLAHARQIASEYINNKQKQDKIIEKIGSTSSTIQVESESKIDDVNPVRIAKKIVEKYSFVIDKDTKNLWYYEKMLGIYNIESEELIKSEIVRLLDTYARARFYVDVDFWIRYSAPKVKMNKNPELVGVENGVLDISTKTLYPTEESEKFYITTKIPVVHNLNAKCPKIEAFLTYILPEKDRVLAQEFIGYCLLGSHPYRKAYIANGPTGTGKTTHQNINTAFLGDENISNQTIQNLNHNRFSPAELFNKMGNFCDDMPASIMKVTGNFKMATGGGRMAAERKGKNPFYFRNRAKLWLNCNDLAPIQKSEDCDAYYERLLIIDYKVQVKDTIQENPNLTEELITPEELSGYLNYAIDGYLRLKQNKCFSETRTREEKRAIYIKRTDSAKYYVENHIIITDLDKDFVFQENLYHDAVKICHNEKIKPMNKGELISAMQLYCPGAHHTKIRDTKGNLQVAWRFIKLKNQSIDKQTSIDSQDKVFVPSVPFVPLTTISADKKLFEKESSIKKENVIYIKDIEGSGTKAPQKRLCSLVCQNFRKPACPSNNGLYRGLDAVVPLKCSGFFEV